MQDWNVVITVRDAGYNEARKLLEPFGPVARTEYYNILLLRGGDPLILLDGLRQQGERLPESVACLARVVPVTMTFAFQTPAEFEERAQQAVNAFLPSLGGKSFHLRMHRRGFKGRLSGMDEERFLDSFLLEALAGGGNPGRISFEDPDAIIALETVGQRAGLSFWNREELLRYPLLHID